jgi:uncharacterized protein YecT (DUF1311 family)
MEAPAFLRRALATAVCAIGIGLPHLLPAADELGPSVEFATADANLNKTYQRVVAALSPSARESLRRAQRAWIAFVEKDLEAVSPFTVRDERLRMRLEETKARQKQLEAILQPSPPADPASLRSQLKTADRELNELYRTALALHKDDAELVREAQRAWVTYREENARVLKGLEAMADYSLTSQRVAQLRTFYAHQSEPVAEGDEQQPQLSETIEALPPGRKIPNPFDRAKN